MNENDLQIFTKSAETYGKEEFAYLRYGHGVARRRRIPYNNSVVKNSSPALYSLSIVYPPHAGTLRKTVSATFAFTNNYIITS
ncbi:MAG: hypothetical protein LBH43_08775 [Treponema sp.]|jgi:hypothetical protein|nr:hypothetical protein [Treponema sp.]